MKSTLVKIWITILMTFIIGACNYNETMPYEEAAIWVAAYSPERIDIDATIRIEVTDSLLAHIDTSRSVKNIFKFRPAIQGVESYANGGRTIVFTPQKGALKQGEQYNCRVKLSTLSGLDSLKEFSFDFVVEKRESRLSDINVCIDPNNIEQVVVTGKIEFSSPASRQSSDESSLECSIKGGESSVVPGEDKYSHSFTIKGIKRQKEDLKMDIKYNPKGEFSPSFTFVIIPGLAEFKLLSAERRESVEPYIELEFSEPLSSEQELYGLISIDKMDILRIERQGTNVKVYYPINGIPDIVLRVSELIRAHDGRNLSGDIEHHFKQEIIPPAIKVPISGTILPDGNHLTFPFRSVNLAAVDVEVVKIYTDNVMTFLQNEEIHDTYRLRRVGRLIYRQTVRLDKDKNINLHQWQNFSIDLKNLFSEERGAIYNIRLSFRKDYSLYDKDKIGDIDIVSGVTKSDRDIWDRDYDYIYREAPDYDRDKYNWREEDDPSKDSYYMVESRMPEYNLMASNIGIIVKRANSDKLWCTVSNLLTAKAMKGVKVTAYNYQMREIGSDYTNEDGFADFEVDGNPFIITASNGISTTYIKIKYGYELSTSNFNVGGKVVKDGVKGFIYGERGVWRPGDDIFLSLIVEDNKNALPQNHPVSIELYTPQGQLYDRKVLTESVDGIYVFKTSTDDNAPTGRWDARFQVGGQIFHHPVRIETIKPNRLKINISSPEILYSDKSASMGIESHWLTGPVASGLNAKLEMDLYNNPHPFEQYKDYIFSNPLYNFSNSKHEVFACTLDSLGKCEKNYTLPTTKNAPGMMQANLIARVAEPGGDESITSRSVLYSPYMSYVGIDLQNKEFETDCPLYFPIVTVNANGEPENTILTYKVYKLDWSWWWEGSIDDLNEYVQNTSAIIVKSGVVKTNQGKGKISFRVDYPSWGKYLIYVEDSVSKHASGGVVYIDWPDWRGRFGKNGSTSTTMLPFSLDKKSYEVGEYATVYLPPSSGGQALLSVENGSRVISRTWVKTLDDKEISHRILVTKDMTPNFYVHATLLQPHGQRINDLPIRMYGVEGAKVFDHNSILHPIIDVDNEILPQQEFAIKVSEQDGKAMSYTLAIVDEGLLDITAFKTPQPWHAMNQKEGLGVRTWDMYKDVIGAYTGKFTSILSVGGDEALRTSAGKEKRFNPVVEFMGPFTLDKGTNTHKITLPMYVGSVRVMVVAAKDGKYGSSDKSVTVRSPLMLLTTMPRGLSCGDRVNMPINIFAMEEGVKDVKISVKVSGPLSVIGEHSKLVTFDHPTEKLINFELACDNRNSGKTKIEITATGNGYTANETIFIEVRNPLPDIVSSSSITLPGGMNHRFESSGFENSEAQLTLATIPTIDFTGVFSFVENYSHYCTEQLSSRGLFILYARKFLTLEEQKRAEEALPTIIKMILSRQLSSGGFAYWPGDKNPHDWVTSMVGEVLTEARRQGFLVPNQNYDKWKMYQNDAARSYRHSTVDAYDLVQAYRLYTLVLAGERPIAAMNKLRESKSISQQALLRLSATYALDGRGDVAYKLLEKVDKTSLINGSYTTFWSTLRDKAMALEGFWLVGNKARAYEYARDIANTFSVTDASTQEIAFVSAAMSRISDSFNQKTNQVNISNGVNSTKIIKNFQGVRHLKVIPHNGYINVENKGSDDVSLSLTMKRKPLIGEIISAKSEGVKINVKYTDFSGNIISVENLKQGEEFLAKIEVNDISESSQSMALTYSLPSGWEIGNERLVGREGKRLATYTDIRDSHITWYFSLDKGKSKCFTFRIRAAYLGDFIIPPTICEDMYNPACRANTQSGKSCIVK